MQPKIFQQTTFILILATLCLIILVLAFTGGLNIASFQQSYSESLVLSYTVAGGETVRKIEYALKYGKPLTNFYGMEDLLQESIDDNPQLEEVQVVLSEGQIVYNQAGRIVERHLEERLIAQMNQAFSHEGASYTYLLHQGKYHIFLPLKDRNQDWLGSVHLVFDEQVVKSTTNQYLWRLLNILLILALVAVLALLFFIMKVPIMRADQQVDKKKLLIVFLITLSTVQIVYGWLNYRLFSQAYQEIAIETTASMSKVIQKDIHSVLAKGVPYEKLYALDQYLEQIVRSVPEVENIYLTRSSGIMYAALEQENSSAEDRDYQYRVALPADAGGEGAELVVTVSKANLDKKMKEVVIDTLTVLVTSFIFMVEVVLFLLIFIRYQWLRGQGSQQVEQEKNDVSIVRPLAFILFIGVFLSTSFIPIVMKQLYQPLFGLAENVVIGLPLSAEMLCGGLATVAAGFLIDRQGWRFVFFSGLLVFSLGTLLSGLAWEPLMFIAARGVVGAGYGFSLMALRGFVNGTSDQQARTQGVSALFSGMYAGINCGVIVGAMLADRLGHRLVFFMALGIVILVALFCLFFIKNPTRTVAVKKETVTVPQLKTGAVRQFFLNYKVLSFFLFILIPTAACSMFLDYYFPLFAESIQVSTSNVGRAFLLNGLVIVYLGPLLSRYSSKFLGVEKSMYLAGLCIVAALLFFAIQGTLFAAFVAVILLGVADSFGLVAQNNYFLNLQATERLGIGKALGFYGNIRKLGQMLGPMIFGGLAFLGIMGVGVVAVTFFLTILFFLFFNRRTKLTLTKGKELNT